MKTGLTTIFCLCLMVGPTVQRQEDDFLDLTKIKPPKQRRTSIIAGGGMASTDGSPSPKPRLKVTLLSLDKRSYQLGDKFIYEVMLENITESVFVIPWTSDYYSVKPYEGSDPPGYVSASLRLVIKDEVSGEASAAGEGVYGSELVPGSLKRLRPGQKVRIRALGQWWFGSEEATKRIMMKLPQAYDVQARFSFLDVGGKPWYEPALSANSLSVELRKRQQ